MWIVELRWTFANLLLLSLINCFGIQVNSAQGILLLIMILITVIANLSRLSRE